MRPCTLPFTSASTSVTLFILDAVDAAVLSSELSAKLTRRCTNTTHASASALRSCF
jgi:hypothetical protein